VGVGGVFQAQAGRDCALGAVDTRPNQEWTSKYGNEKATRSLEQQFWMPPMKSDVVISIVSPVFNEEECLEQFYAELNYVLEGLNCEYEVVLVDDGSVDRSAEIMRWIHASNPRWRIVHLARNFGHQAALSAGLDLARGQCVVAMDSDLQDRPSAIPGMLDLWRQGYQVVYAVRQKRKEGVLKRFLYRAFYRLFKLLAEVDIPLDSGDFSLMDRRVVNAIKELPEHGRFVRGLRSWAGFRQIGLEVERDARAAGTPKYTFLSLFKLASDGIFGFSRVPLRILTAVGGMFLSLSFVYLFVILILRLTGSFELPGWTTTVSFVILFGAMQLLSLGLLGEYVGRIYDEVKGRPVYILAATSDEEGYLQEPSQS
jgi:polyisoprenyl-phosphate glycosyltransferase